jgi:tetratricopeptide (TPR) repeat protein
MRLTILAALALLLAVPQATVKSSINFPITSTPAAHDKFILGVIALHNASYEDAADYFRSAEALDPNCVMAYWGESMTFNHPFWASEDIAGGRKVLAKLGATRSARLAKAKTEREREYLNAVELLWGDGDKDVRDNAFADALHTLASHHPEDVEAATFYAAALIGTLRSIDHTYRIQMQAAAILKPILDKYPDHPGALHYYIHANDDPAHAHLALAAARRYEKVAGESFHAQHMPSHIYVQLGMWSDVVRANQTAFDSSDRHMRAKGQTVASRDYHSLEWLMYGELQMGQYKKAREAADLMLESAKQPNVPKGMGGEAAVFASRFAAETQQWDILAPYPEVNHTAELLYAQGMSALNKNDLTRVRNVVAVLNALSQQTGATGQRTQSAIDDALKNELSSALALHEKQPVEAERLAAEAVRFEATMEFPSGPPDVIKPAYEFYGETLLALNKPAQAAEQFQIALKHTPKRALSLLGLARALAAMKDNVGADKTYHELAQIWANADPDLPAVQEVRNKVRPARGAKTP